MLNKYETIYIIKPDVEADGIKAMVEKFKSLIETNGGVVSEIQEWGMKRLAYSIDKIEQGYYVLVNFEAKSEFISELERIYKITDEVIKFITIRKEDKEPVKDTKKEVKKAKKAAKKEESKETEKAEN